MFKVQIEDRVFSMSAEELEKALEGQPVGRTIQVLDCLSPKKVIHHVRRADVMRPGAIQAKA